MRWACDSSSAGQSGLSGSWPVSTSSMRRHSTGQSLCATSEVSSEIEQGALSHLRADAFGAYEAKGEVGLAGARATGLCASDEHADTVAAGAVWRNTI